jgi:type I restriction enzyme R subunit
MRLKNVLTTFADFNFDHLVMNEQLFEDYKSKYLDLWQKVKTNHQKEKVSILEDVDFELELIHRDEINVTYILKLLANLKGSDQDKKRKEIIDLIAGEAHLRSKRELIEKFILENLPAIEDADDIPEEFEKYWNAEQIAAFKKLCADENLTAEKVDKIIDGYLFAEREPLRDEVLDLIEGEKPSVLQRKTVGDRILNKILGFVDTFINGMTT